MKPVIILTAGILFFQHQANAQQLDSATVATPARIIVQQPAIRAKMFYAPSMLMIAGIAANSKREEGVKKEVAEELQEHMGSFHTRLDNYLQFSPIVLAYGLDAMGFKSKNTIGNRTAILLKSEIAMTAVVFSLKSLTHQLRPDGSAYTSFPSGHTAQAFAAATFLSEEYKDRFHWMPWAAYGIASGVGMLRMANNKHYISDVLVGAGIGILSTKLSYATHQYKWDKKKKQKDAPLF